MMNSCRCRPNVGLCVLLLLLIPVRSRAMDWVRVGANGHGFMLDGSGREFVPWGFNYDHDEDGRLLEDYWTTEWPKVEQDFREMKALGANVVRIHLQLNKFLKDREEPNHEALDRLRQLLELAEQLEVYLDLTGLGCYHKKDVPPWYDALSETDRWTVQARFWDEVARCCAASPAVFCYDLMNEPVVPGGRRAPGDWLGGAFAGKHFVQFITLDQAGRTRPEIARDWIQKLTRAIRARDRRHLITVGLVDWSLDRPGLSSGFVPEKIVDDLDFLCVHIYPEAGKVGQSLETLKGFTIGKPVVVEETFPLKCSIDEFATFAASVRKLGAGLIGFYWGKTLEECRRSNTIPDAFMVNWLTFFTKERPKPFP